VIFPLADVASVYGSRMTNRFDLREDS